MVPIGEPSREADPVEAKSTTPSAGEIMWLLIKLLRDALALSGSAEVVVESSQAASQKRPDGKICKLAYVAWMPWHALLLRCRAKIFP